MFSEEKKYNLPFDVWAYYDLRENWGTDDGRTPNFKVMNSDKHLWLAKKVFTAFPQDVTGLKFFTLDCGCIYYHRVFPDGLIDPELCIYRDAKDGPCEICIATLENWGDRIVEECVVYNSSFQLVDK